MTTSRVELADLGPDLRALVEALGAPVRRIDAVSARGASATSRRATYRIDVVDGRCFKGRRLPSAAHAAELERLARQLPPRAAPLPLARRGRALLESWIAGSALDHLALTAEQRRACGRLLGAVHRSPAPEEPPTWDAATALAALDLTLDDLARRGALRAQEVRAAARFAAASAPMAVEQGLIHRDLCPENLVLRPDGTVCAVDSGSLRLGPLDSDLARTWYRWPMPREAWETFLEGYREARDPSAWLAAFPFWACTVLADAARLRLARAYPDADVPVVRLRRSIRRLRELSPATPPAGLLGV